jgi:hypothetical protein
MSSAVAMTSFGGCPQKPGRVTGLARAVGGAVADEAGVSGGPSARGRRHSPTATGQGHRGLAPRLSASAALAQRLDSSGLLKYKAGTKAGMFGPGEQAVSVTVGP